MDTQIAVGGFWHETNSFSPWRTGRESFAPPGGAILRGSDEMTGRLLSNCPVAGFVSELEQLGYIAVPVVDAFATPSGTISRETYEAISNELVEGMLSVDRVGAFLVSLHGAAVADGCLDPEGEIMCRLRTGQPNCPIGVVLDHHAGVTEELVAAADLVVGYKTEPHIDMAACGAKAAREIARLMAGDVERIDRCLIRLPVLLPIENLLTTRGPLAEVMVHVEDLERRHGDAVVDMSVFPGFAYSDSPATGASVLVQTNADEELAFSLACELADDLWARRGEFLVPVLAPPEAVERALRSHATPVVLVDKADHPGAGGVGDASVLLKMLCERGATDTVVAPIYDPASVRRAVETGVGGTAMFRVGGMLTGEPYEVRATVRLLSDGHYEALGPMDRGAHLSAGRTSVLEAGGVEIVVCEGRSGLYDPEFLRRIGIEPSRRKILCIKGLGTFRAAFEPLIGEVLMVDGEGAAQQDLAALGYEHVSRPIEPLDRVVEFDPTARACVLRGREWPANRS